MRSRVGAGLAAVLLMLVAVCLIRTAQGGEETVYSITRRYYDAQGREVEAADIEDGLPDSAVASVYEAEPPAESGGSPESSEPGEPLTVDINSADIEELDRLPGIGPALAQRIIDYREAYGGFRAPEELMEVSGIGDVLYGRMAPYVTVGEYVGD